MKDKKQLIDKTLKFHFNVLFLNRYRRYVEGFIFYETVLPLPSSKYSCLQNITKFKYL